MRYEFIQAHRAEFEIKVMCRVLDASRSGYYAWRKRPVSSREMANQEMKEQIDEIYQQSRHTYGSPRIRAELADRGIQCGVNRIARLMNEAEMVAKQSAKFKVMTTDSDHDYPVAPNLLGRDFTTERPNEKWLSDITYIPTDEGWLYLALVMDLYSRRIIGWAMADNLQRWLAIDALQMALETRQPPPGLIHHSDRGSQYASKAFRQLLKAHGLRGSMSRKGDCWDNAVVESFFGSLKQERVQWKSYQTRWEAQQDILQYISVFYNGYRLHSTLNYVSPNEYERQFSEMKNVA